MNKTEIDLDISGMTCASCAARIEKVLVRQPGVDSATVNLVSERARVSVEEGGATVEDLCGAVERAGYGAAPRHDGHMMEGEHGEDHSKHVGVEKTFSLGRVIFASVFTVPLVVISMSSLSHAMWAMWVAGALVTPVQFIAGWPFLRSAAKQARFGAANMDTLVAVGTLAAYFYSVWTTAVQGHDHYFEVAGVVITLLLLGKYLENLSKGRASEAIRLLLERGAKEAIVVRDGLEVTIPVEQVRVGDHVIVRPGATIPADGIVIKGTAAVDTSIVTGESVPREVGPGDEVMGGTIDTNGSLVVEATRVGSDAAIARIARMVEEAQTQRAPIQRLADRISSIFVPTVLVLAALTFAGWLIAGAGTGRALTIAVSVLIIACPCAMGLATPVAIMVGTGRGAQLGVIIRSGEVLERVRGVDVVLLDKTGTVTTGAMAVTDVVVDTWNDGSVSEKDLLAMVAAVEAHSEHPIARAIVTHADERGIVIDEVDAFEAVGGRGARATVNGVAVSVGRPSFVGDEGNMSCTELDERREALEAEGKTVFVAGWGGRVRGLIAVADAIKPTSAAAVRALRDLGLRPVLLTGDTQGTAEAIAAQAGIDDVIAGVLPEQKVEQVRAAQAGGSRVAMVGDGINDAPALAAADLGIAVGSGADVAIEAGDITLVRADLLGVATAVRLARRTYRVILQNLGWAFGYNILLIPLAMAGQINPMLAGFAMAASSVSVVVNALRLRRVRAIEGAVR